MNVDERYMWRALELAAHGEGNTSPNPMVGAVIVAPDGRIIGEGYHRRCGEGHAEVNAIASVKDIDRPLLKESTMYVSLEPCSHYGKTPPCAKLIIDTGIPRVIVGAGDPFKEVSGKGISMLRDAGIEVVEGVLASESRFLNRKFMTAHGLRRPFVTLKWACSADGYMASKDGPYKFSDYLNSTLVHRLRSLHDAILVGSATAKCDNPRLDCRLWPGKSPRPVVADRHRRIKMEELRMLNPLIVSDYSDISQLLEILYREGITSLLVEGGPTLLQAFIDEGLWDEARVETSPVRLGTLGCSAMPSLNYPPRKVEKIGNNVVKWFQNPKTCSKKHSTFVKNY